MIPVATVTFDGVSKLFPSHDKGEVVAAVRDLNLTIEEGQLVTLLGPSGCGKTTILRMLAGFETPTSGSIRLDDTDVTRRPVNSRGIGMVFQSYALFPHMSVRENVAYGLSVAGVAKADAGRRVDEVMELMQIGHYAKRAPNQLSGGQQQRVALARAVVTEPRVLLFDEPLSNLDAQLREQMRVDLRAIQQRLGITSLYVTHDQSEALAIADEIVVLKDGVIQQRGSAREVYRSPASSFVARFLGKANIVPGTVVESTTAGIVVDVDGQRARMTSDDLPQVGAGESVSCVLRPENVAFRPDPEGALTVEQVVFQGSYIEYHLQIAGAPCTIIDHEYAHRGTLSIGDRLSIDLTDTPLWIVPADA